MKIKLYVDCKRLYHLMKIKFKIRKNTDRTQLTPNATYYKMVCCEEPQKDNNNNNNKHKIYNGRTQSSSSSCSSDSLITWRLLTSQ